MLLMLVHAESPFFNVRDFGAVGDGETIDSTAINAAIQAASDSGGGTVLLPAGVYASCTIRQACRFSNCATPRMFALKTWRE